MIGTQPKYIEHKLCYTHTVHLILIATTVLYITLEKYNRT